MGTRNDRRRAVGLLLETLSPSPQPRKGPSKRLVEREREEGGKPVSWSYEQYFVKKVASTLKMTFIFVFAIEY